MKDRDYYYLKEIIFGLREEYARYKQRLMALKKIVRVDDKGQRLKDFYFKINGNLEDDSPTILCKFNFQKKFTRELLEMLEKKLGFFTYGKYTRECILDNEGNLSVHNGKVSLYGDSEEFHLLMEQIINSPFAENIFIRMVQNVSKNYNPYISLNFDLIRYMYSIDSNNHVSVDAVPDIDGILIKAFCSSGELTLENLNVILHSMYPKSEFLEYHRDLIESNSVAEKPLRIVDNLPLRFQSSDTLMLEEDKQAIVLRRSKK